MDTIAFTHSRFLQAPTNGWLVLDNSNTDVEESAERVLSQLDLA